MEPYLVSAGTRTSPSWTTTWKKNFEEQGCAHHGSQMTRRREMTNAQGLREKPWARRGQQRKGITNISKLTPPSKPG